MRVIEKMWALPGTEPMPGLKEREGKKKEKKRTTKKYHSTESNPGPLTLMDIGRYAYNSERISADIKKQPEENTDMGHYYCSVFWTN